MAVAVADIIIAARTVHEAFGFEAHPDSVCLAFLSRYHRMLMGRVASIDPESVAEVQQILKATWEAGWDYGDTGVAAQDHHIYLPGRVNHIDGESWDILHFSPWAARAREFRQVNDAFWPAYSIVSGNIHFHGAKSNWSRYASADLYYVPMTAALASTDDIALPDSAESSMVAALAYHLCQRSLNANSPGAPDCALLRMDWMENERAFLYEIGDRRKASSSTTLDVW